MILRVRDEDLAPALDMTPMIDCVFNLLIFFLVASTYQQAEREMLVALPQASSAAPISVALRELIINVDADGRAIVNGKAVEPDALQQMVRGLVSANAEQKVSVRGDKRTAYANVVRVLDICKKSGVQQPFLDTVLSE